MAPSERQARELAPLLDEPDELRDAWAEASTNGTPTAERVREVVARRRSGGRTEGGATAHRPSLVGRPPRR